MKPRFHKPTPFHAALKLRASESLAGGTRHATGPLLTKAALIMAWFLISYGFLMFVAGSLWTVILGAASLVLAMGGLAFNVLHDGGHGAYSQRPGVNRTMAMALDLLGGSSFIWKWKHNILHHTYPNMLGVDADINLWPLARVSEEQPRYRIHRFQCWYIWGLYALLPLSWYVGDLRFLVTRKLSGHPFPRPRGADLAALLAWKAVFIGWAIVLPLMVHPLSSVITVWLGCSLALGLVLSIPFQVAHCVTAAGSIRVPQGPQPEWAIHQVQATANFATGSRWLTWYLGGLNFQIEHHLFPSIAHIHYPRLSPIVRQVCGQFGVQYAAYATLGEALRSHFDWLRQLGTLTPPR